MSRWHPVSSLKHDPNFLPFLMKNTGCKKRGQLCWSYSPDAHCRPGLLPLSSSSGVFFGLRSQLRTPRNIVCSMLSTAMCWSWTSDKEEKLNISTRQNPSMRKMDPTVFCEGWYSRNKTHLLGCQSRDVPQRPHLTPEMCAGAMASWEWIFWKNVEIGADHAGPSS